MNPRPGSLPFSQACENNKGPILAILRDVFFDRKVVLEIGSGTGQHAAHLGPAMPHLSWQTSDLAPAHTGIRAWLEDSGAANVLAPVVLDVAQAHWPVTQFDALFTANTLHIMSWQRVRDLFDGIARHLPAGGKVCIYGPFNYGGAYTSESNARFDTWLRSRDPASGLRDFEAVCELASGAGLGLRQDHEMPANNRLLEFRSLR